MKRNFFLGLVVCAFGLFFSSAVASDMDPNYGALKKKLMEEGTGTFTGWTRLQQRNLIKNVLANRTLTEEEILQKSQNEMLEFLETQDVPTVEFFFLTPDEKGMFPLQRFVLNSCTDDFVQEFLLKILTHHKVPLLKALTVFDWGHPDSLVILLVERFPILFMESLFRLIFDDKRFGYLGLEKLLGVEREGDKKTVARLLSERLLMVNKTVKAGLDELIKLDRRLEILRISLEKEVSLLWCQIPLSQQELSQVLINYIVGNKEETLLFKYLRRLFSVLLPYTVNVLTALSKESGEQVLSVMLKYGIIEPLIIFLLGLHPEKLADLKAAKTLLLTPNAQGESLLYQTLQSDAKDLMVSVLLVGKSFIDQLVAIPNHDQDTVVHLAAQKQANDFFSVLIPLFVEQKKLRLFFNLLKTPGKAGKSPVSHLISGSNLDLLKKLANHYAAQFKKILAEVALKEHGLHLACAQDDENLVSFLLNTTKDSYKGKQKLLFSYDEKGLSPTIFSIEEQYLSALQALLEYAHDIRVLGKVLRQKDVSQETSLHLSAFHKALLSEDEGPFLEITKFLKKKGLRSLFDALLKSKASNQKTGEQLLEEYELVDRKKFFSYVLHKLSVSTPENTLSHHASLTSFAPSTIVDSEQIPDEGKKMLSLKAAKSLACFSKHTKLIDLPYAKEVVEL